jgi:ribonuclease HII
MQAVLNFSSQDKGKLVSFLAGLEQLEPGSHEEIRCRAGKSTLTLYKSGKLLIQGPDFERVKKQVLRAVRLEGEEVLGIDETGRGESFGPFVVAAVLAKPGRLLELRDSKKTRNLEAKARLVEENASGISVFSVSSKQLSEFHKKGVSLNYIEAYIISYWHAFFRDFKKDVKVFVDGSPIKGVPKEVCFVVKGDDLNPVIGAASVIAKQARNSSQDKGEREGWGQWGKKKS